MRSERLGRVSGVAAPLQNQKEISTFSPLVKLGILSGYPYIVIGVSLPSHSEKGEKQISEYRYIRFILNLLSLIQSYLF
jgi:hypothetical protein